MIGDRLGKWVLLRELGRGGMGRVFLARDELAGRTAALKLLAGELAQEAGFLQRFQREIETLALLDHPHIVRFYESGYENNQYFYAMEYVEGLSLDELMTVRGRLPWTEVLDIARQIVPALRHVHDHGIIHRDLKPSNLLRDHDGNVKLSDFGIAKVFTATQLTAPGGIVGSVEFISPEQASGKVVGKRSDIYSLGAVFYLLLTGRPPFTGGGQLDILHKHRYTQCDRPQSYVPDLPFELDELIVQMLAKEPADRPNDCFVLGKMLDGIQAHLSRKDANTDVQHAEERTRAENTDVPPAPVILSMPRRRADAAPPKPGGPIAHFFNHPWVLATLLLICVGILVWTFWPPGERALYEQGKALMATGRLADMERAWQEYLEPLATRFPDNPYRDDLATFRQQLEAARAPLPTEAERFYRLGEAEHRHGNSVAARQVWRNLVNVFGDVSEEKEWVRQALHGLAELDRAANNKGRWASVRVALERAAALQRQGKEAEARRIWDGLEQLYRDDPTAAPILDEARKHRPQ